MVACRQFDDRLPMHIKEDGPATAGASGKRSNACAAVVSLTSDPMQPGYCLHLRIKRRNSTDHDRCIELR
jgi:hypothetical protein